MPPATGMPVHSLFTALDYTSERPVIRRGYASIIERFLGPAETVRWALLGDGWTFLDPLLLVTDQRALRLRQTITGSWHLQRTAPAGAITGASLQVRVFFGKVRVHLADGTALTMLYRDEAPARIFVDGVQGLRRRG